MAMVHSAYRLLSKRFCTMNIGQISMHYKIMIYMAEYDNKSEWPGTQGPQTRPDEW